MSTAGGQLLDWLNRSRQELRAAWTGLDPGSSVSLGWDLKALLCHITGWDEVALQSLRAFQDGGEDFLLPAKSIDAHNQDMVSQRGKMAFQNVIEELEATREELKAVVCKLEEPDFHERIPFPWGSEGEVGEMIAIIAHHEQEHAEELSEIAREL